MIIQPGEQAAGRYLLATHESVRIAALGSDHVLYGWYQSALACWDHNGKMLHPDRGDDTKRILGRANDTDLIHSLIPWHLMQDHVTALGKGSSGWYAFDADHTLIKTQSSGKRAVRVDDILSLPDADSGVIIERNHWE